MPDASISSRAFGDDDPFEAAAARYNVWGGRATPSEAGVLNDGTPERPE